MNIALEGCTLDLFGVFRVCLLCARCAVCVVGMYGSEGLVLLLGDPVCVLCGGPLCVPLVSCVLRCVVHGLWMPLVFRVLRVVRVVCT